MHSVRHLLISFSRSLPYILGQVFFYTICIYISNPIYIVILFSYWFSKNTLSFSKLEVNITVSNQYLSVWSNIFFYFEKKTIYYIDRKMYPNKFPVKTFRNKNYYTLEMELYIKDVYHYQSFLHDVISNWTDEV